MAPIRATTRRPADEEFLQQLYRGGELLAAGKVIEAKDYLERAHRLQPRNEKGQNLLGLTYFKLGLFDRAAEIYEALVRENPADPTLRVNLGLVYLKTNALQRAIREFETSTDLSPDHKKAQNYLGLALAQAGEFGRAREHFLLAGSEAMAEKMSRAIAGETFERPPPKQLASEQGFSELEGHEVVAERGGEQVDDVPPEAPPEAPPSELGDDVLIDVEEPEPAAGSSNLQPVLAQQDWGDQFGFEGEAQAGSHEAPAGASQEPAPAPAPMISAERAAAALELARAPGAELSEGFDDSALEHLPSYEPSAEELEGRTSATATEAVDEAPAPAQSAPEALAEVPAAPGDAAGAPPVLLPSDAGAQRTTQAPLFAELVPSLQLFTQPLAGPFQLLPEAVAVVVRDELLTRLSGLVAISGSLELSAEPKRSRGRSTDKSFGEGDRQVFRARGAGVITVDSRGKTFLAIDLAEESGYFREEAVFAFEEPVMFENGRVPSQVPPDLDLVHLRGKGQVLLELPGPLRSLEVRMDRSVTIPMGYLVGWHGNITPRLLPLGLDLQGKPARAGVELSGEGFALLSLPV